MTASVLGKGGNPLESDAADSNCHCNMSLTKHVAHLGQRRTLGVRQRVAFVWACVIGLACASVLRRQRVLHMQNVPLRGGRPWLERWSQIPAPLAAA